MANEAQEAAAALLQALAAFKFTPQQAIKIESLAGLGRAFGLRLNAVEDGLQYLLDNNLLVRDGEVNLYLTDLGCEKMREAVNEASRLAAARRKARGTTVPEEVRRKRDALAGVMCQVNWCGDDDGRIDDENMEGAGPGGWLNVFGWYVVGTTGGGNAIVVRVDDPAVYYAGHEWYGGDTTAESTIDFEDFGGSGKGKWVSVPFTADGMRQSLFRLAASIDDFRERAEEIDAILDKID